MLTYYYAECRVLCKMGVGCKEGGGAKDQVLGDVDVLLCRMYSAI